MDVVAELLDMAPIRVYEVGSFYTMFNLKPIGRYHLQVCTTTPCWLRGSDDVVAACKKVTGIAAFRRAPAPTACSRMSEVECLGACSNAPMMQVSNQSYYEDLDGPRTEALLEAFRRGETPTPGSTIGRQGSMAEGGPTTLTDTDGAVVAREKYAELKRERAEAAEAACRCRGRHRGRRRRYRACEAQLWDAGSLMMLADKDRLFTNLHGSRRLASGRCPGARRLGQHRRPSGARARGDRRRDQGFGPARPWRGRISRRGSNGASCRRIAARSPPICWSIATRASRAPARTARSSATTRTSWSRAASSRVSRWGRRRPTATSGASTTSNTCGSRRRSRKPMPPV